ncbi:alanyl-tRNA synthetase [Candidatus Hakubella thermalkaliphila]|uniref:Alanine--tRNA ligase n=1 Tax=Candidatus Hakubella thermalkaliphila TaxID=2754717 RepID=A0A6V8NMQ1_9ACTN|nr:alanine--tRNA ligase [Candidatus Hakubella thermalkaliphila]MBT9170707.1 Alanine--tRNA ligase [Actinomycetota bacterium]GFP21612.1 alanyl-tRNA synthetase [Candidatus Hakubella thermalkaliphila]
MVQSAKIREKFLSFFEARGHKRVSSSSLVPDDPTLLLTSAGMVQFKPYFLGQKQPEYTRATTVQKCFRTTDIEAIGDDRTHLTFFEMLGNFSFGDYYKAQAIPWAWELVTEGYKLDRTKLWITIFEDDDEAFDIWNKKVGLPQERIFRLGEKTNFWNMGPTGPCGPCSEIHYDQGEGIGCGRPQCDVTCECGRFLEIWNLVFMQYDRQQDGSLLPLPKKNIDTGLGLERVAAILQDQRDVFRTDLLAQILKSGEEISGAVYGQSSTTDRSLRILADHSRAITFLISDGVLPSNEGRGYILRRMLRRAVRHGKLLDIQDCFLANLSQSVITSMGDIYPELLEHQKHVQKVIQGEEERFSRTLKQGFVLLDDYIAEIKVDQKSIISGDIIFKLYDTYGFPVELTQEIASEEGLSLDMEGYEKLMGEQKERARSYQEFYDLKERPEEVYRDLTAGQKLSFVGYEKDEVRTKITSLVKNGTKVGEAGPDDEIEVVLGETPFYAERGGQVGDKGEITTETGRIRVEATYPVLDEIHVQRGVVVEGRVAVGQEALARINAGLRKAICRNHTTTHLLHWALRLILGDHVKQAGSLVEVNRLRFDYSHFQAPSEEELVKVENLVNNKILDGLPVRCYVTSLEHVKEMGAIALFGEKYGEFARVVEVGDISRELCGGTHVANTGAIGLFRIISESSIGSNLRRIEAVTGFGLVHYLRERDEIVKRLSSLLGTGDQEIVARTEVLLRELKNKEKELVSLKVRSALAELERELTRSPRIGGTALIGHIFDDIELDHLKVIMDNLQKKTTSSFIVLASKNNGRPLMLVAATADLVEKGIRCDEIVREVSPLISGGGGGKSDFAQAGGKSAGRLAEAVEKARMLAVEKLKIGSGQ